jgi:DNA replication protein DnaC
MPLETMLRRLHLANAPRIYRELCDQAEREHWSYHDFLATLVAEEIAHRQQTRLQRLSRKARFPFLKTIEEFDFTFQSTVRQSLLGSYLTPDFITDGRCLVLSGKTGRGKTHLAIAIAYRAIQNGFDALFCTAAALIDTLSEAASCGKLRERLHDYVSPDVLVIDEVGYLSYGPDAANVLFHVVNERHQKKRAMLFTTNKSTNEWGNVLHDHDLADVIVDRILERGRTLKLDGPSYRTKHLGLDGQPQAGVSTKPARISGIQPAEFLEPTSPRPATATRAAPWSRAPGPTASRPASPSRSRPDRSTCPSPCATSPGAPRCVCANASRR